jgi:hypothetical protein
MACGGTCGCDDCGAEKRVATACELEPLCETPPASLASTPQHPEGGRKPRDRAPRRIATARREPRVVGETPGALFPPQAEPSRATTRPPTHGPREIPAPPQGRPEPPVQTAEGQPDALAPDEDLSDVVAPQASSLRVQPPAGDLERARKSIDAPQLGATQARGKGGGGEDPPAEPEGNGPKPPELAEVKPDPCAPCKCECVPVIQVHRHVRGPELRAQAAITPRGMPSADGVAGAAWENAAQPEFRAPPMTGMGVGSEFDLAPAQMADGGLELDVSSSLEEERLGSLLEPRESGSAVTALKAVSDDAFELQLLGTDFVLAPKEGDRVGGRPTPVEVGRSGDRADRAKVATRSIKAAAGPASSAAPPQMIDPSKLSRRRGGAASLEAPARGTRSVKGPPGSSVASARTPPQRLLA